MSIWDIGAIAYDYVSGNKEKEELKKKAKKAEAEKKAVEAANKQKALDEKKFSDNLEAERAKLDSAVEDSENEASGLSEVVSDFSDVDNKKTKMLKSIRNFRR
jgi:predicted  nucleic acid-binding Zn-ribbon protein